MDPITLLEWSRDKANHPGEKMSWRNAFWDQVLFMRDKLPGLFLRTVAREEPSNRVSFEDHRIVSAREELGPWVISTHTSKSIKLPVVEFRWEGHKIVLRDNFYDWKITVETPEPIPGTVDFHGIFQENEKISACYCEGFSSDRVHGSFIEDRSRFTIAIADDNNLWTFLFLYVSQLHKETEETKTLKSVIGRLHKEEK